MDSDMEVMDKLIQEKLLKHGDGPYEFEGHNCNDYGDADCSGWDGQSRRCNCGNRRVSWNLSDCKTYIYAEAW